MACGEFGMGRMSEPLEIVLTTRLFFFNQLAFKRQRALVTAGPTYEAIDPVRFIGNRSSGKQGHAIARALTAIRVANTTLISGPTQTNLIQMGFVSYMLNQRVEMLSACEAALPADIAVCAAAVSDWRVESYSGIKN